MNSDHPLIVPSVHTAYNHWERNVSEYNMNDFQILMGLVYDPLNNVCQVVWLKEAPTRFPIRLDGAFVHFKCFVLSCNLDAQMNYIYDLLYEIKTSVVTVTICVSKLPDETSVYVAERQIPRHIGENVLSYPRTQVYMENFATATPHIRYLVDRINYVLPLFRVLNE